MAANPIPNAEAGDICPECELDGVPGALCPFHAKAGNCHHDLLSACRQMLDAWDALDTIVALNAVAAIKAAVRKAEGGAK